MAEEDLIDTLRVEELTEKLRKLSLLNENETALREQLRAAMSAARSSAEQRDEERCRDGEASANEEGDENDEDIHG